MRPAALGAGGLAELDVALKSLDRLLSPPEFFEATGDRPPEAGQAASLDDVLLASDGDSVKVGTPVVDGAKVTAEVVRQGRTDKIIVFHRKRRKGYRKKNGHRQGFTEVRVSEVVV